MGDQDACEEFLQSEEEAQILVSFYAQEVDHCNWLLGYDPAPTFIISDTPPPKAEQFTGEPTFSYLIINTDEGYKEVIRTILSS